MVKRESGMHIVLEDWCVGRQERRKRLEDIRQIIGEGAAEKEKPPQEP
jgi:hypothetical protein